MCRIFCSTTVLYTCNVPCACIACEYVSLLWYSYKISKWTYVICKHKNAHTHIHTHTLIAYVEMHQTSSNHVWSSKTITNMLIIPHHPLLKSPSIFQPWCEIVSVVRLLKLFLPTWIVHDVVHWVLITNPQRNCKGKTWTSFLDHGTWKLLQRLNWILLHRYHDTSFDIIA